MSSTYTGDLSEVLVRSKNLFGGWNKVQVGLRYGCSQTLVTRELHYAKSKVCAKPHITYSNEEVVATLLNKLICGLAQILNNRVAYRTEGPNSPDRGQR